MQTVTVCDVGPRDGLQNEPTVLTPETRVELVNRLSAAGVPRIEAASFVNPKLVPAMAGADEVFVELARALTRRAREDGVTIRVTLSVVFGCPFAGRVDPDRVLQLVHELLEDPPDEISLADTIGVAVPNHVTKLVSAAVAQGAVVGAHFHNTRNTGFANAVAAIAAGASVVDGAIGGTGGCPFAPRATGNIATEDLVYLLEEMGIPTGIDLDAMIETSHWLGEQLGKELPSLVARAGGFPVPAA
jgi:isopropylmalate/homocitrate/citramalate synthase